MGAAFPVAGVHVWSASQSHSPSGSPGPGSYPHHSPPQVAGQYMVAGGRACKVMLLQKGSNDGRPHLVRARAASLQGVSGQRPGLSTEGLQGRATGPTLESSAHSRNQAPTSRTRVQKAQEQARCERSQTVRMLSQLRCAGVCALICQCSSLGRLLPGAAVRKHGLRLAAAAAPENWPELHHLQAPNEPGALQVGLSTLVCSLQVVPTLTHVCKLLASCSHVKQKL